MMPIYEIGSHLKRRCFCASVMYVCLFSLAVSALAQTTGKDGTTSTWPSTGGPETFATPQQAAEAMVEAAGNFDIERLAKVLGADGRDIILTGEPARDRQMALAFAAEARQQQNVSMDPKSPNRAFFLVGKDDWPFPVPIVKQNNRWSFDAKAGRQEILYRRIGRNELDAIQICRGYVEAQYEYAFEKRSGYSVHQYAQRIISTPGKQDGLAWRNPDGTWGGPIGEKIAQAIEQGYTSKAEPYHGYFFKVLKGQGPAAPLGQINYVIKGVMIGGFALVAAPAQYGATGIKTFIISNDGVVYEKDFGNDTLNNFKRMELFNPDKTWDPVEEQ